MKNIHKTILCLLILHFSLGLSAQTNPYKDPKLLATSLLKCIVNSDTAELRKSFIDMPFIHYAMDLSLTHQRDSARTDSAMRASEAQMRDKLFNMPFMKLSGFFKDKKITQCKIDSLSSSKEESPPGAEAVVVYDFIVHFTSNKKKYSISLSIAQCNKLWCLVEIDDNFDSPE